MAREINLVPDIKNEMIKTLKLRNIIFFLCIVVASVSVGASLITGLIAGGQQLALDSKKATIDKLSDKLNSYGDLSDYLTIQGQLDNLSALSSNKKVLSRTFNILTAMLPSANDPDTIKISELNVELQGEQPTFSFDAQANAGRDPYIDYNVLDSFKKSMDYLRYDYGRYVDKDGNTIPAYCMIESGSDGSTFNDETRGIYAFWTINAEGCNPSGDTVDLEDDDADTTETDNTESTTENGEVSGYAVEDYEGTPVVRVWRTPQFNDWYKTTEIAGQPYMGLDGTISNVPHFESACIKYSGTINDTSSAPKWTDTNEECKLVPDGVDGIIISESSNGRDESEELVLRFSASIALAPEVFSFSNYHMRAIAPAGRRNVTDSYVQIQAMFSKRAADCAKNDAACNSNTNSNGSNTNSSNTNSNGNGGN